MPSQHHRPRLPRLPAPVLTILIGGNHEASNYFQELHYGGWVAPSMFYLGAAGVVRVHGLRIAGVSGIYDEQDYPREHDERVPYGKKALHSVFHTRVGDVERLGLLGKALSTAPQRGPVVDIMMSHDWPRRIENHGDTAALRRQRPDFAGSIARDGFGSPGTEWLLRELRPRHWFAGHMHVRFEATVDHDDGDEPTRFLALDQCRAGRPWFEVMEVAPAASLGNADGLDDGVFMDPEWLAILRATHDRIRCPSGGRGAKKRPELTGAERAALAAVVAQELAWVHEKLKTPPGDLSHHAAAGSTGGVSNGVEQAVHPAHPDDQSVKTTQWRWQSSPKDHGVSPLVPWIGAFCITAPPYGHEAELWTDGPLGNPQTDALLALLELPHRVTSAFVTPAAAADCVDSGGDDDSSWLEDPWPIACTAAVVNGGTRSCRSSRRMHTDVDADNRRSAVAVAVTSEASTLAAQRRAEQDAYLETLLMQEEAQRVAGPSAKLQSRRSPASLAAGEGMGS